MSYKALYRKYRPKTFDDVMGQDHIVKTLKNIITGDRVSHAFLFSGPRGTGKTSVANVFAREVNRTAGGKIVANKMDIIEMDAASNNGVNEIRHIVDQAVYAPTEAKYKVYIIDEVHMLTKGAFNALLKTLEEPPAHVIFILATTEPHKIPATILSRTQRFNFKRIDKKVIENQLKEVLNREDIQFEDEALRFIARISNGGLRDALSIADQAASFGENKITFFGISQVFGLISQDNQIDLINLAYLGDAKRVIVKVNQYIDNGLDIERVTSSLIDVVKDYVVFTKTSDSSLLTSLSVEEVKSIKIDLTFAYEALEVLVKMISDLRFSQVPRQTFELGVLKMCRDKVPVVNVTTPITTSSQRPPQEKPSNIFETAETSVKQSEIVNTDELDVSAEKLTDTVQAEVEQAAIEEEVISTQEVPLNEMSEVIENTEDIDLVSMFDQEKTDEITITSSEGAVSEDEIINLFVQFDKDVMAAMKERLSKISSYGVDAKSSSYVSLLENIRLISGGPGFALVSAIDESTIKQLRLDKKTQSFIDFTNDVFGEPIYVLAITKDEFDAAKEAWSRLSANESIPQPKPIPKLKVTEKRLTAEEEFGADIFGDLFKIE